MATTANRQDFINRARRLAADFIKASNDFNALAAEVVYTHLLEDPSVGGLTVDDFVGQNDDITPGQLVTFFSTMQALLAPLTVEEREAIYAVKSSGSNNIPLVIPPPLPTY